MVIYLTSLVVFLCGVGLLTRAPLFGSVSTLLYDADKSSRVIASKHIADLWKEKVLPAYSQKVFLGSLKLFVICVLLFAVLLAISYGLDLSFLSVTQILDFLSSWQGISYATVVSVSYYYARSHFLGK